ncbi:MAG: zinc dependent phospholipase C family protein [Leptospirales bacterium]|nr:zinc dependent phospholipase C family protein [Leptospirales bacterium]
MQPVFQKLTAMPGIVTHKKIFKDSLKLLFTGKKHSRPYLLRSVSALLANPAHMRAALFGLLGPNIFDYIPTAGRKDYGHRFSFMLHDKEASIFIRSMIDTICAYEDKNNEWVAMQRAYLYGMLCHLAADEILHPYVFYRSGFPDNNSEINFYREQNLLFQYNIDNYFLYRADDKIEIGFNINEMIPFSPNKRTLVPAVKDFILCILHEKYPDIYRKMVWFNTKKEQRNFADTFGWLDIIPHAIIKSQNFKRNYSERIRKLAKEIRYRELFYSDFLVQYQLPQKTNTHHINQHREAWLNPIGSSQIRYDSVLQLCRAACEKTVELWEQVEDSMYTGRFKEIHGMSVFNAYTGSADDAYADMKRKSPVRMRLF